MRYVDEYRNEEDARRLFASIRSLVTRPWTLMEICGGQTHTLIRCGIDRLLPEEVTPGNKLRYVLPTLGVRGRI